MNLATIYSIVSVVAFVLAGLAFVTAVVMWFNFDILKVIGDLSGRTAKKSIEKRRTANEKSGVKSYRPTPIAVERGALTDTIENSDKLKKDKKKSEKTGKSGKPEKAGKLEKSGKPEKGEKTGKSGDLAKAAKTAKPENAAKSEKTAKSDKNNKKQETPAPAPAAAKAAPVAQETTVLSTGNKTDVLEDKTESTTVLSAGGKTDVLDDEAEGTTVLSQQGTGEMKKKAKFTPVQDVLLFASDEIV